MADPVVQQQPDASQAPAQQEWNPVAAVKAKYPNMGMSDQQIANNLLDPGKFRSAFPEYADGVSDDEIKTNVGKFMGAHPELLPNDYLSKTEHLIGQGARVAGALYDEAGQAAQGLADFAKSVANYQISPDAKLSLSKGYTALRSGNVSEAQMWLRKATTDFVTNHPIAQQVQGQWESSARNREAAVESAKKGDMLSTTQHVAGVMPVASFVSDAMDKAVKDPTLENVVHAYFTGGLALAPLLHGKGGAAEEAEIDTAKAFADKQAELNAARAAKPSLLESAAKSVTKTGAQMVKSGLQAGAELGTKAVIGAGLPIAKGVVGGLVDVVTDAVANSTGDIAAGIKSGLSKAGEAGMQLLSKADQLADQIKENLGKMPIKENVEQVFHDHFELVDDLYIRNAKKIINGIGDAATSVAHKLEDQYYMFKMPKVGGGVDEPLVAGEEVPGGAGMVNVDGESAEPAAATQDISSTPTPWRAEDSANPTISGADDPNIKEILTPGQATGGARLSLERNLRGTPVVGKAMTAGLDEVQKIRFQDLAKQYVEDLRNVEKNAEVPLKAPRLAAITNKLFNDFADDEGRPRYVRIQTELNEQGLRDKLNASPEGQKITRLVDTAAEITRKDWNPQSNFGTVGVLTGAGSLLGAGIAHFFGLDPKLGGMLGGTVAPMAEASFTRLMMSPTGAKAISGFWKALEQFQEARGSGVLSNEPAIVKVMNKMAEKAIDIHIDLERKGLISPERTQLSKSLLQKRYPHATADVLNKTIEAAKARGYTVIESTNPSVFNSMLSSFDQKMTAVDDLETSLSAHEAGHAVLFDYNGHHIAGVQFPSFMSQVWKSLKGQATAGAQVLAEKNPSSSITGQLRGIAGGKAGEMVKGLVRNGSEAGDKIQFNQLLDDLSAKGEAPEGINSSQTREQIWDHFVKDAYEMLTGELQGKHTQMTDLIKRNFGKDLTPKDFAHILTTMPIRVPSAAKAELYQNYKRK